MPITVSDLRHPFEGSRKTITSLVYLLRLPFALLWAWRLLRRNKVRVVNAHYPGLPYLVFGWLRQLGLTDAKFILSFHLGDIQSALQTKGLERKCWIHLLHTADCLVACSDGLREMIEELDPTVSAKIAVVYNGVDLKQMKVEASTCKASVTGSSEEKIVICVARFEERKGHAFLLNAFRRVAESIDTASLLLVGASGPTSDSTRMLIERLGLGGRVQMLENLAHAHVIQLLHEASVLVLPSTSEGFPLAILEAGAVGLPVIATRVVGIRELIEDRVTGLLVDTGDEEALGRAMQEMLQDGSCASRLAGNLHSHISRNLTWESAGSRYMQLSGFATGG
jgi:glycosyltransferase involved in cell wall biosynthesis